MEGIFQILEINIGDIGGNETKSYRRRCEWKEEEQEGEIGKEEFRRTLKRIKNRMAIGEEEIPMEMWKYGG